MDMRCSEEDFRISWCEPVISDKLLSDKSDNEFTDWLRRHGVVSLQEGANECVKSR